IGREQIIMRDYHNNDNDEPQEQYIPHPYGVKPKGNYYFDSFNADFVPYPLRLRYMYSDYLFHIWRCSSVDLRTWERTATGGPDTIDRRANMTHEQFTKEYLIPNKPVILTDAMADWGAKHWTRDSLQQRTGDTKFYINSGVYMTMREYLDYAAASKEENPMYLFDHYYGENMPSLLDDYSTDRYFKEDLFAVLGKSRPSYRWLLAGPARSGATFHKDPNHTSAWNAVVTGRKKWVMYPPHITPPGVHPSDDGLEVTTPHSIVEWFINYYERPDNNKDEEERRSAAPKSQRQTMKKKRTMAQLSISSSDSEPAQGYPLECVLEAGEMIYVPCGWWHCVLNLEESIAITHNFIDSHNILKVIDFMATKKKKDLFDQYQASFEQVYPGRLAQLREQRDKQRELEAAQEQQQQSKKKKQSVWDKLIEGANQSTSGNGTGGGASTLTSFSFNFHPS
ncbi:hypothetical protein SAMD00019534_075930, partial [Acytostelium subglobosum LB1]|uniref:hypothetical protein n=1 Tax=Acytostelium subglobosum LB1 TaxID=1410327 RepID=UPI000644E40F